MKIIWIHCFPQSLGGSQFPLYFAAVIKKLGITEFDLVSGSKTFKRSHSVVMDRNRYLKGVLTVSFPATELFT